MQAQHIKRVQGSEMADTQKIATITYGDFTCRLEGYDNPLEVVKPLVSYFRGLMNDGAALSLANVQINDEAIEALTPKAGGKVEITDDAAGVSLILNPLKKEPEAWHAEPLSEPEASPLSEGAAERLQKARNRAVRLSKAPSNTAANRQNRTPEVNQTDSAGAAERNVAFTHLKAVAAAAQADDQIQSIESSTVKAPPKPFLLLPAQRIPEKATQIIAKSREEKNSNEPVINLAQLIQKLDIVDIQDMVEATAAYRIHIKGFDSFTCAELTRELEHVGYDIPRDDILEAFGALLFEGRIERTPNRRFGLIPGSVVLAQAQKVFA